MSYANQFLRDFYPVFAAILKEVRLKPENVELEIIDEEDESYSNFEPVDVKDVLEQFSEHLNNLTIFTDRPEYFMQFVETMYEENGLIVSLLSKEELGMKTFGHSRRRERKVTLDFEWEGGCYKRLICPERYYIPIHKKKWVYADAESVQQHRFVIESRQNLDIIVPIGYNTMTVKGISEKKRNPNWDRFEAAFYEEI